jgi:hypothetical protein
MFSGLIAVTAAPVADIAAGHSAVDIAGITVLTLVILFAHRENIVDLILKKNVKAGQAE